MDPGPPEEGGAPGVYARVGHLARERIAHDSGIRRNLPGGGRLFLDRALPFVLVYREPPNGDDAGTRELVTGLAAHAYASGNGNHERAFGELLTGVARTAARQLGAFVIIELWSAPAVSAPPSGDERAPDGEEDLENVHRPVRREPAVTVVSEAADDVRAFADELVRSLKEVRMCPTRGGDLGVPEQFARVDLKTSGRPGPPGLPPLAIETQGLPVHRVGLEITPFYRSPDGHRLFPRVILALQARLTRALEDALFAWSHEHTSLDVAHARGLGRTRIGRAARLVDERLAEVYSGFDLLMQVTPVNSDAAWDDFREGGFAKAPAFRYRPLPFDPEHIKRRLFHVPIERVEDPLLADLFREKQEELDRQVTLLRDVGTPQFLHSSRLLYGEIDEELVTLARAILDRIPAPDQRPPGREEPCRRVGAEEFCDRARQEIVAYETASPEFHADVQLRDDITSGLMVSKGTLCVSTTLNLSERRVQPLLSHEVGTHLVTYCNGRSQPFGMMASGLSGYDPLQEGLAVLAEYLVGGLTPGRARTLAGRVVGVSALLSGASFPETYHELVEGYGFRMKTAFNLVVRVFRGGGLVKDAFYLAGLRDLLGYLRDPSHSIEPLYVGKLALPHIDAVQELVLRGILHPPFVKPLWMNDPAAMARLEACRDRDVLDLIEEIAA